MGTVETRVVDATSTNSPTVYSLVYTEDTGEFSRGSQELKSLVTDYILQIGRWFFSKGKAYPIVFPITVKAPFMVACAKYSSCELQYEPLNSVRYISLTAFAKFLENQNTQTATIEELRTRDVQELELRPKESNPSLVERSYHTFKHGLHLTKLAYGNGERLFFSGVAVSDANKATIRRKNRSRGSLNQNPSVLPSYAKKLSRTNYDQRLGFRTSSRPSAKDDCSKQAVELQTPIGNVVNFISQNEDSSTYHFSKDTEMGTSVSGQLRNLAQQKLGTYGVLLVAVNPSSKRNHNCNRIRNYRDPVVPDNDVESCSRYASTAGVLMLPVKKSETGPRFSERFASAVRSPSSIGSQLRGLLRHGAVRFLINPARISPHLFLEYANCRTSLDNTGSQLPVDGSVSRQCASGVVEVRAAVHKLTPFFVRGGVLRTPAGAGCRETKVFLALTLSQTARQRSFKAILGLRDNIVVHQGGIHDDRWMEIKQSGSKDAFLF
ncbi:hypothetical protein CLF_109560 [Clonorchis sinensis]|uniref:Uncharacterized protein n=1 Tax=Clonorchis sinensis TaxID=79923 RepID=G7YJH7_CLOSI|nr:hypothetical protein CLF_109560 [Clonorchis sinensis]